MYYMCRSRCESSLGNYTSNNTPQPDTTRVPNDTIKGNMSTTRQHECNMGKHKYSSTQHEYNTAKNLFSFIHIVAV